MSTDASVRRVHVLSLEAGSDRAQELAAALVSAGAEVALTRVPPVGGDADADRLRRELAAASFCVRAVLGRAAVLLLADARAALAAPEMMRVLLDEQGLGWDEAWSRVRAATVARLGCPKIEPARPFWTAGFLEAERPRLLEILYEINRRHLDEAEARWPGDLERRRRLSLFREGQPKRLRPGLLAVLASRRADVATPWDGLAADALADLSVLHGRRLRGRPTPVFGRGWLVEGNPALAALLAGTLGAGWDRDRESLAALESLAFEAGFRDAFRRVRRENRERLAALVRRRGGPAFDPESLVDVRLWSGVPQERPLLNVLGLVREHLRLTAGGWTPPFPRTVVLAGRLEERLAAVVRRVAGAIEADARARSSLRVVVLPERDEPTVRTIVAAADISNQPGSAGSGAAGTRGLALALNGAVTLGTRDGTVRELQQAVGEENLFLFGLSPIEARAWREGRVYRPQDVYAIDPLVRMAVDALVSTRYAPRPGEFDWVRDALLDERDPWLVLADLGAYVHRQDDALAEFADPRAFTEKAIVTIAGARRFWVDALEPSA